MFESTNNPDLSKNGEVHSKPSLSNVFPREFNKLYSFIADNQKLLVARETTFKFLTEKSDFLSQNDPSFSREAFFSRYQDNLQEEVLHSLISKFNTNEARLSFFQKIEKDPNWLTVALRANESMDSGMLNLQINLENAIYKIVKNFIAVEDAIKEDSKQSLFGDSLIKRLSLYIIHTVESNFESRGDRIELAEKAVELPMIAKLNLCFMCKGILDWIKESLVYENLHIKEIKDENNEIEQLTAAMLSTYLMQEIGFKETIHLADCERKNIYFEAFYNQFIEDINNNMSEEALKYAKESFNRSKFIEETNLNSFEIKYSKDLTKGVVLKKRFEGH